MHSTKNHTSKEATNPTPKDIRQLKRSTKQEEHNMHFSGHSYTKQLDDDVAPVAEGIPAAPVVIVAVFSPAN